MDDLPTHRILRLWHRPVEGAPPIEVERLAVEPGRGIVGDHTLGRMRHVTIVFEDDWNAALRELGGIVDPVARRANVLVSGGGGARLVGHRVRLGDVALRIRGLTRPCPVMDRAADGLMEALGREGRAGIWGRLEDGTELHVGDALEDRGPVS